MSVLANLESLRLRASYSTLVTDVIIHDVTMDTAVDRPRPGAEAVVSIERCDCPAQTNGSSCEVCSLCAYFVLCSEQFIRCFELKLCC